MELPGWASFPVDRKIAGSVTLGLFFRTFGKSGSRGLGLRWDPAACKLKAGGSGLQLT